MRAAGSCTGQPHGQFTATPPIANLRTGDIVSPPEPAAAQASFGCLPCRATGWGPTTRASEPGACMGPKHPPTTAPRNLMGPEHPGDRARRGNEAQGGDHMTTPCPASAWGPTGPETPAEGPAL
jgi:hypothetical protein